MKQPRVFVYGTLKPGEANYPHYCRGEVLECQPAFIWGRLYHLNLGYPAVTPGTDRVFGYCLRLPNLETLARLDQLEDFDPRQSPLKNEYNRRLATIYALTEEGLGKAWVYWMSLSQIQHYQGEYCPTGAWQSAPNDLSLVAQRAVDLGQ